jgi:hypothetical protein
VSTATAQAIVAQSSGLANPGQVIDFGANLFPSFTPITNQFGGITVGHAAYFTTGVVNNLVGGFLTNNFSAPAARLLVPDAARARHDVAGFDRAHGEHVADRARLRARWPDEPAAAVRWRAVGPAVAGADPAHVARQLHDRDPGSGLGPARRCRSRGCASICSVAT